MSKNIVINTNCLNASQRRPKNTTLKPNKIKQALINRIKTYHSELLNKNRIEAKEAEKEINIATPTSEYSESVELFNQMAKDKEKREERRQMQISNKLISGINNATLPSPELLEESKTRKKRPMLAIETNHNNTVKIMSTDHVPYGILKGGTKPTFRQFNKPPLIIEPSPLPQSHSPDAEQSPQFYEERSRRFNNFKKQHNNEQQQQQQHNTRRIRKNIKKHRTLGKYKDKIGVLVKNYDTRRQIERECALLKETPIGIVKDFLRQRGFIKMGSSAPDVILRQMYESCILSGDVNNLNGENLIHNYLADSNKQI